MTRILLFFSTLSLISCAAQDMQQSFLEQGTRPLSQEQLIQTLEGNTVHGEGFAVYYAPDGTKYVRAQGQVTKRRWWRNEQGEFCETLYQGGATKCAPQWYVLNDEYLIFENGTLKYRMRLLPGKPEWL